MASEAVQTQPTAPIIKHEPAVSPSPPSSRIPENVVLKETPTEATRKFVKSERNGVIRTLGSFIKTGIGELFTYIGGNLVPGGIAIASQAGRMVSEMREAAAKLIADPQFRDFMVQNAGVQAADQFPQLLNETVNLASAFIPGLGVGATVTGLIASGIGYGMGWSGVQHGGEKLKWAYKLGKAAEMGTLAASLFNPSLLALYPVVKGFNIATTFIGHMKKP